MPKPTDGADVRQVPDVRPSTNGRDLRAFDPPRQNWTRVPNRLFGMVGAGEVSHAELCVLLYLIRHLWGFNETARHLSLDEIANGRKRKDGSTMDAGAGVSVASVKRATRALEERGLIVVWRESTKRGPSPNCYALRLADEYGDGR